MLFVTFFLIICIANLVVGFALAFQLGYGPPTLAATWETILFNPDAERSAASDADLLAFVEESEEMSIEDLLNDEEEDLDLDLETEVYEDDEISELSKSISGSDFEIWDLDEKYVEMSIMKLNIAMMKSGMHATQLDTRLRAARGSMSLDFVSRCRDELRDDCEEYLQQQQELSTQLSRRIEELGDLKSLGEEIEMSILEQAAQIETTLSNLKHMNFEADLEEAGGRLIAELNNLRIARHNLRDRQEEAFLTVSRYENRLDAIEERLFNDPLTNLRNRVGLEVTLHQWWKKRLHTKRQMSIMLFNIENFGDINEEIGHATGDRMLKAFADEIRTMAGRSGLAARFAGDDFFVLLRDKGPNQATKEFEVFRQSVQRRTFVSSGISTKVTITSAITAVSPEDASYTELYDRLLDAHKFIKEEKGSNVGCLNNRNQNEPELIESPNFGASEETVSLD